MAPAQPQKKAEEAAAAEPVTVVALPSQKSEAPAAPAVVAVKPLPAPNPVKEEVKLAQLGPVSLPESLAKLVSSTEFHFIGSVAPRSPLEAPAPVAVVAPEPVAAIPQTESFTTVTTSSNSNCNAPAAHPALNGPARYRSAGYFTPSNGGVRPYGGDIGSAPRYYSAQRHFNAQPYHPSYQTQGYGMYQSYGNPYHQMGYDGMLNQYGHSRLQTRPPYYPPTGPQPSMANNY